MRIRTYGAVTQCSLFASWFPVNCYLVEEDDSVTLVDAALAPAAAGIEAAIKRIGKPLARIALTHAHDDHVGALDRLKRAFPAAEVIVSAREARLLSGDKSLEPSEARAPIKGGPPKSLATRPDRTVEDGDRIGSLLVVATPGHTPGHVAFLDTRTGALLAGDALQTRGRTAVAGDVVWSFPFPALATWHAPTALESAKKLAALRPTLLGVGHGDALERPEAAMAHAIDRAYRAGRGAAHA